jgi:hypothetical protein
MAKVRVYVNGDRVGPTIGRILATQSDLVREATQAAAVDFVSAFRARAAVDIAGAGKFGSRWTDGFTASVTQGGGNIAIDITHQVPYFNVFQYGAKIVAKNPTGFLWFAPDGDWWAANRSGPVPAVIKKASVTIPKKFHSVEIAREMAQDFRSYYYARRAAQKA